MSCCLIITKHLYTQPLEHLQQTLKQKKLALINREGVLFHYDNARPQLVQVARVTIQRLGWETLYHPPYFLDLEPTDKILAFYSWEILRKWGSLAAGTHKILCLQDNWFFFFTVLCSWKHVGKNSGCRFLYRLASGEMFKNIEGKKMILIIWSDIGKRVAPRNFEHAPKDKFCSPVFSLCYVECENIS